MDHIPSAHYSLYNNIQNYKSLVEEEEAENIASTHFYANLLLFEELALQRNEKYAAIKMCFVCHKN